MANDNDGYEFLPEAKPGIYVVDANGDRINTTPVNQPIGRAAADSKRIGEVGDDGRMWLHGATVVHPPFSGGLYASDADQALKTLPRIIQRMVWAYAKWRLK